MTQERHNSADAVRWKVELSFVAPDNQNGYQKEHIDHGVTMERAIVNAIMLHTNEPFPLKGVCVYECVFVG